MTQSLFEIVQTTSNEKLKNMIMQFIDLSHNDLNAMTNNQLCILHDFVEMTSWKFDTIDYCYELSHDMIELYLYIDALTQ